MSDALLVCPSCGREHGGEDERFCAGCGMPLVIGPDPTPREARLTERQRRARKVKPQYGEGPLVRVAGGRNQAEAEFIQGMLLEEGVPSTLRRSRGFDVPEMLAGGPRDVLVPASGAPTAHEVLLQADLAPPDGAASVLAVAPARLLAGLLAGVGVVGAVVAVVDLVG